METQNIKILHPEDYFEESCDNIKVTEASARSFFSSPCFLSEFDEEEDSFKI
jgi:hypothetical protein